MFRHRKTLHHQPLQILALTCMLPLGSLVWSQNAEPKPEFPLTQDSIVQAEVPKGTVIEGKHEAREQSVFPGTQRDYAIYLPHGFDSEKEYPYMVFQDGIIYQAPVVFDNLISKKEIPPLIGIFIRPGVTPPPHENALPRFNRSFEYDSVSDRYARFVLDEFLPDIVKKHGFKLSTDPNQAGIAGSSSGGIAAFVAAWHRPDAFRRVYTGVGTYVGLRGGDQLSTLVRKTEPKPIRFFLQDGSNDLNIYCGDWWMANQTMQRALSWAGYAVDHRWADGGHDHKHASQVMPDAMRWIWKDWQKSFEIPLNEENKSQWKGLEILQLDSEWKDKGQAEVSSKTISLTLDAQGNVLASDQVNPRTTLFQDKKAPSLDDLDAPLKKATTTLSPDQTLLYLAPQESAYIYSAQITSEGQLKHLQPFYMIHPLDDGVHGDSFQTGGMCVDQEGRLYVATNLGIQVCDQAGRVNYILRTPGRALDVCFGGPDFSELHVLTSSPHGNKVYHRKTKTRGIHSASQAPIVPEKPRL